MARSGGRRFTICGTIFPLALVATLAHADEPTRLVTTLDHEFERGTPTQTFSAPTTEGRWFLTVQRSSVFQGAKVLLNGKVVLRPSDFWPFRETARVEVDVAATNELRVRFGRRPRWERHRRTLKVRVEGVIPESLAGGAGERVEFKTIYSQEFTGSRAKHKKGKHGSHCPHGHSSKLWTCANVEAPTTGLYWLSAQRAGGWHGWFWAGGATVVWNGRLVFPSLSHGRREAPVLTSASGANALCVKVTGHKTVTVEISGFAPGDGGGEDTTPPVLAQPVDLAVEQAAPAGTAVTFPAPVATDETDPNPVVVCVPDSGSTFPAGMNTVTCTATDASGNSSQVSFVVIVTDTTPPSITIPGDLAAIAEGPEGAVVTYATSASDAADPAPNLACTPPSGSLFPVGVTQVTCVATDAAGNQSQSSFSVTVTEPTPVATRLAIAIPPAPAGVLALGQPYDLVVRAEDDQGRLATGFEGLVELATTDPGSQLNGLLLSFTPADLGVHSIAGVAQFDQAGSFSVSAQTLPGGSPAGAIQVEVVAAPPTGPDAGYIHGIAYHARENSPLAGAKVTVRGISGAVLTGDDGRFEFPVSGFPAAKKKLATLEIDRPGFIATSRSVVVTTTRDSAVLPVYLVPRDALVTEIGPEGGVARSASGNVVAVFPPGAAAETLQVTLTSYQDDRELPVRLPTSSVFTYCVELEPEGAQFAVPVKVYVNNTRGFANGAQVPVGVADRQRDMWTHESMATFISNADVPEDLGFASAAAFQVDHFSARDLNYPVNPNKSADRSTPNEQKSGDSSDPDKQATDPGVTVGSGELQLELDLPATRSLGRWSGPRLMYSSGTAAPSALIAFDLSAAPGSLPDRQSHWISIAGVLQNTIFQPSPDPTRNAIRLDARNARGAPLATGSYEYEAVFQNVYPGTFWYADYFGGPPTFSTDVAGTERTFTARRKGRVVLNNQTESPFGAGWSLAGLDRLHFDPDRRIVVASGDGATKLFSPAEFSLGAAEHVTDFDPPDSPGLDAFLDLRDVTSSSNGELFVLTNTVFVDGDIELFARTQVWKVLPNGGHSVILEFDDQAEDEGLGDVAQVAVDQTGRVFVVGSMGVLATPLPGSQDPEIYVAADEFSSPAGCALDEQNVLYVSDEEEGTITAFSTRAGNVVATGLDAPGNLTFDEQGRLYVICQGDDTVRRFAFRDPLSAAPDASKGEVVTDGLQELQSLTLDRSGNLFVSAGNVIYKITREGTRSALSPPIGAEWSGLGLEFDGQGSLYLLGREFEFLPPNQDSGLVRVDPASISSSFSPPAGDFSTLRFDSGTDVYTQTLTDGTQIVFETTGLQRSIVDRNGNTQTYAYTDADGDGASDELEAITNAVGQVTRFTYDAQGRLATITDPAGRVSRFLVDAAGDLVSFTDPAGGTVQLAYNADHLLTDTTNPRGHTVSYEVDAGGVYRKILFPTGREIDFDPALAQGLINNLPAGQGTIDNPAPPQPAGSPTVISGQGDLPGQSQTDRFGALTEWNDPEGRQTKIERDPFGQPTQITRPTGHVSTFDYDDRGNLLSYQEQTSGSETQFTYEPNFNQVSGITWPDGGQVAVVHDAQGNPVQITNPIGTITEMEYDPRGLPTQVTVGKGTPVEAATTSTYDPVTGNPLTRSDPLGNTTTFTYDAAGNVASRSNGEGETDLFSWDPMGRLLSHADPRSATTAYAYDAVGNLIQVTDPLGRVTRLEYDSVNQVAKVTDPKGNEVRFTYDLRGNRTSRIEADGSTTSYTYDGVNRLVKITDAVGREVVYAYGTDDRVLKVTRPDGTEVNYERNEWGAVTALTDARGSRWETNYDTSGRPVLTTDPLGNTRSYTYTLSGALLKATDEISGETTWSRDPLDRVTSITNALGFVQQYAYYLNGTLASQTDVEGNPSTFSYDRANRLTASVDAEGGTIVRSYLPGGLLAGMLDPRGNLTRYAYDLAGRQTKVTHADGRENSFVYDEVGNVVERTNRSGHTTTLGYDNRYRLTSRARADSVTTANHYDAVSRLTRVDGDLGVLTYAYDLMGRVTESTQAFPGQSQSTVGYGYDQEGNRTSLTYPDGSVIQYEYDAAGRLKKILSGTDELAGYEYDAASRPTEKRLGDGTVTTATYDALHRLKSLVTGLGGGAFDSLAFTHDKVGNVLTRTDPVGQSQYTYNKLYELTQAAPSVGGVEDFAYDKVGNRSGATYTAGALNQYLNVGGTTQSYDLGGNLTSDGTRAFSHDVDNQLVGVSTGVTYSYGPQGRLASRTSGASTTRYVYDGSQVLMETDGAGNETRRFVYGPGIDRPIAMLTGGQTYYYHWDGLGNVKSLTNTAGAVVEEYRISAYGKILSSTTGAGSPQGAGVDLLTAGSPSSVGNPYFFQGRRWDPDAGVYYFRARHYDPEVGRFLQLDPAGIWFDAVNRGGGYGFVGNNPVNLRDPFGLSVDGVLQIASSEPSLASITAGGREEWLASQLAQQRYLTQQNAAARDAGYSARDASLGAWNAAIGSLHEAGEPEKSGMLHYAVHGPGDSGALGFALAPHEEAVMVFMGGAAALARKEGARVVGRELAEDVAGEVLGPVPLRAPKGICFTAGTLVATAGGPRAIESIQVGERVLAKEAGAPSEESIVPDEWVLLHLSMPNPDGSRDRIKAQLLRPKAWVEQRINAKAQTILVDLDELGFNGRAAVERVEPCPQIEHGSGRVVLATFTHLNGYVLRLQFEGSPQVVEPTRSHRFWSVTRQGWVQAGALALGEKVSTAHGPRRLVLRERKGGVHRVFNLEVQGSHTYYVSGARILVHNNGCAEAADDAAEHMRRADLDLDPHDVEFYGGAGVVYRVPGGPPGVTTPSGRPYIGTADDMQARVKSGRDGRDRTQAVQVGSYPLGNTSARKQAEQRAMDNEGGLPNLDNKRNEIRR